MQKQRTRHRRRQQALALLMAAVVLMPAGGAAQDLRPGGLFGQSGGAESGGLLGSRKWVYHPASYIEEGMDDEALNQLNLLYARDYTVWKDAEIFFKSVSAK